MKLFLLLLLNFTCINEAYNQPYHALQINLEITAKRKITCVEVEASDTAMVKIIKTGFSNFTFPKKRPPKGNYIVKVKYVLTKDGSISVVKSLTTVGYGLEEEALRLVKKNGVRWVPAQQGGREVKPYRSSKVTSDSL